MQPELRSRIARGMGSSSLLGRLIRSEIALGATVVAVAVTVLAAAVLLYTHPLNRKTVSFDTTDAASLNVGADVRVAGVTVGKVTKIDIQPTTVRVEAEVSDDTFIGADSTVDVRMLTPVGGYAITVVPIGDESLGDAIIPVERVTVPYSIGDVLQAAPHVTDKVDGGVVDANIEQVAQALQHNPTSVGSLIAGMNSIATVMDQQRDQVRRIADLSAEFLQTFNGSRDFVFELLRQIEIVESTYNGVHVEFNHTYQLLGDVFFRIESVERFYLGHKEQVLAAVTQARDAISEFQTTISPALDQLQAVRAQLEAWLGPEGLATIGGGTILASGICVPIPGRTC